MKIQAGTYLTNLPVHFSVLTWMHPCTWIPDEARDALTKAYKDYNKKYGANISPTWCGGRRITLGVGLEQISGTG